MIVPEQPSGHCFRHILEQTELLCSHFEPSPRREAGTLELPGSRAGGDDSIPQFASALDFQDTRAAMLDWYHALDGRRRRTFWSCFSGYATDSMDVQLYPFVLTVLMSLWGMSNTSRGDAQ